LPTRRTTSSPRIRHARTAKGIEAKISLADRSKAQRWTFAAMAGPG